MAKWITYQKDILRIYNAMRKKGEEFKDKNGNCLHLIELPGTKEMYIVAYTKKNGDSLYKVTQVDALSESEKDENGRYVKNKYEVIPSSSFNHPVSGFVPSTYEVIGKSLEGRILIHRSGSSEHIINNPFRAELRNQVKNLSKR